jgi:predicted nucleic acid-binding protein
MPSSVLILDDFKARTLAKQLNLRFTGTMGVLLEAKQKGLILSMKEILQKISTTNFRLSEEVQNKILG